MLTSWPPISRHRARAVLISRWRRVLAADHVGRWSAGQAPPTAPSTPLAAGSGRRQRERDGGHAPPRWPGRAPPRDHQAHAPRRRIEDGIAPAVQPILDRP